MCVQGGWVGLKSWNLRVRNKWMAPKSFPYFHPVRVIGCSDVWTWKSSLNYYTSHATAICAPDSALTFHKAQEIGDSEVRCGWVYVFAGRIIVITDTFFFCNDKMFWSSSLTSHWGLRQIRITLLAEWAILSHTCLCWRLLPGHRVTSTTNSYNEQLTIVSVHTIVFVQKSLKTPPLS